MSQENVAKFLTSVSSSDEADVRAAMSGSGDKVDLVCSALSKVATQKGFSFSQEDMKDYLNHLKVQYHSNPTVRVLFDSHCKTSCHIGSQLTGTQMR